MARKTVFQKGSAGRIKRSGLSAAQAARLSKAIVQLEECDLKTLQAGGKVHKLNVPNRDDVYVFRAGMNERILFSPVDGQNVIHDIVDVRSQKKVRSLLGPKD